MATIHHRRQPVSSHHSDTDPESDWNLVTSVSSSSYTTTRLTLRRRGSALSSSAPDLSSDALLETDDDDFQHRHSDSDPNTFIVLPSHDGEGNFGDLPSTDDDLEHIANPLPPRRTRSRVSLPLESSDPSMPNLLLPGGGISPPSFAREISPRGQPLHLRLGQRLTEPQFIPTVPTISTVPKHPATPMCVFTQMTGKVVKVHHPSEVLGEHGYNDVSPGVGVHDLERNPMHHPTLLTTLWHRLSRLATDFLDAEHQGGGGGGFTKHFGTVERIAALVGEAREEGMLPFGSHLMGYGFGRRESADEVGSKRFHTGLGIKWEEGIARREMRERPWSMVI